MHLGYSIAEQGQVPVIIEQPGLDARYVLGQPFAVPEGHEHVLPAVQQQDRLPVGGTSLHVGHPQATDVGIVRLVVEVRQVGELDFWGLEYSHWPILTLLLPQGKGLFSAMRATRTIDSGSSPFTWKIGIGSRRARSEAKREECSSAGPVVNPIRLLTMTWNVPPTE